MTQTVPINNLNRSNGERPGSSTHDQWSVRAARADWTSRVPRIPTTDQSCVDWTALRSWEDDGGRVPRVGRAVRGNMRLARSGDLARGFAPLGVRSEEPSAVRRCA